MVAFKAVKEHRIHFLMFLISNVWVQIPVVTLVSLSSTLNHDASLQMGRKAVGPVKLTSARKKKGFAPSVPGLIVSILSPCKPLHGAM